MGSLPGSIVHLCSRAAWEQAQEAGGYRSPSLETEGFIHCSRPEQVLQVANAFYRRLADPVLLWIDPGRLRAGLRWEEAGGQRFPHIYGPLDLEAVVRVTPLPADADGVYRRLPAP